MTEFVFIIAGKTCIFEVFEAHSVEYSLITYKMKENYSEIKKKIVEFFDLKFSGDWVIFTSKDVLLARKEQGKVYFHDKAVQSS